MSTLLLHVGPLTEVSGWGVLGLWSWDWLVVIPAALGILYAMGLRKWPTRPRPLKPWQPYCFYAGITMLVIAMVSPVGALDDDLFLVHMIQHLLLVLIGPPLILLGSPTTPLLRALPARVRMEVVAPVMRNRALRAVYGAITLPSVAWLLFVGDLVFWHFYTAAYDSAVGNGAIHTLEHVTFLFVAMLFWMVLVDPRPMRSRLSYPLRAAFLAASILVNVIMGAAITFQNGLLYESYAAGPRLWSISAQQDQQIGGLIMWIVGDIPIVAALLITVFKWMEHDQEKSLQAEAGTEIALRAEAPGLTSDTRQ